MNIYGLTSLDTQALIEILSNSEDYLIKTYDRVSPDHKLGYLYQVKYKNGFGISIAKVTYPLFSDEGSIESFDSLYSTLGFKRIYGVSLRCRTAKLPTRFTIIVIPRK